MRLRPRDRIAQIVVAATLWGAAGLVNAAPDEAGYGAAAGYPVGTRLNWFQKPFLVGSFSAMDRIFPVRAVRAGSVPRALPPASDYIGERLWASMGAKADAAWIIDPGGMEAGYCCLSARLRDYARLGLLMQDDGVIDGNRLLPAGWIESATTVRLRDGHLQPRRATPYFGYGYQTWIFPDQIGFALLGVRGQAVFVHPQLKLVMVQTAVWAKSSDPELARARSRFEARLTVSQPLCNPLGRRGECSRSQAGSVESAMLYIVLYLNSNQAESRSCTARF